MADPQKIYEKLIASPLSDFLAVVGDLVADKLPESEGTDAAKVYQRIHFQLIDARQRIKYLENNISEMEKKSENNPLPR